MEEEVKVRRFRRGVESNIIEGIRKVHDEMDVLSRVVSIYEALWGLAHEEIPFELVSRLCRKGGSYYATIAASLMTLFATNGVILPGEMRVLYTVTSRDAEPTDCVVHTLDGGRKYRFIFINTNGESFCTMYEVISVGEKRQFIAYPCPTSYSLEGKETSDKINELGSVVNPGSKLEENKNEEQRGSEVK